MLSKPTMLRLFATVLLSMTFIAAKAEEEVPTGKLICLEATK